MATHVNVVKYICVKDKDTAAAFFPKLLKICNGRFRIRKLDKQEKRNILRRNKELKDRILSASPTRKIVVLNPKNSTSFIEESSVLSSRRTSGIIQLSIYYKAYLDYSFFICLS